MAGWLSVTLTTEEREALHGAAGIERRDTRDMAALLIRQALEARGWLKPIQPPYAPQEEERVEERERGRA